MIGAKRVRGALILVAMIAIFLSFSGTAAVQSQVLEEQRIEILIQNSEFVLTQPRGMQLGLPTVIILRNQDIIQHGFTSPMMVGMFIKGEAEGMTAYGKGIEGFYVNPDKTLVLRFTPERQGRYEFRCDLHPNMKGEVFLMEMSTA
ncbi:MAG: hypothetical protein D6690_07755 [Nitrospirae bacterium]|nr:MAG: hypothetical protein D6690_07755 [Nitrospirota bacterium]